MSQEKDTQAPQTVPEPIPPVDENFYFQKATALDAVAASDITMHQPTQVVIIAGESDSAKTTLLCSIYERLNDGELFGFKFAATDTFHAFEKICHASRAPRKEDAENDPDTVRTKNNWQSQYLHLKLVRSADGLATNVLFSDIEGEVFDNARKSTKDCQSLTQFRRADRIVCLLDGKKIVSKERNSHVEAMKTLLRSLLDNGMLGLQSHVDLLVTKSDVFDNNPKTDEFIRLKFKEFETLFLHRLASLRCGCISPRPDATSKFELCHGLEAFFDEWITKARKRLDGLSVANLDSPREIDRYRR